MTRRLTEQSLCDAGSHDETSNGAGQDVQPSFQRAARVGLIGGRNKSHSAAEKLWARTIKQPSGCWEVQGYPVHNGYIQINRKAEGLPVIRAHRLAWELAHGPIPDGQEVCHRCDNRRCVNPVHLFLGTTKQNIHDCIWKGRRNAFGRQKLQVEDVRAIRWLGAHGVRHKDIAEQFGVRRHTITGVLNRKSWAWLDAETLVRVDFPLTPSVDLPVRGEVH